MSLLLVRSTFVLLSLISTLSLLLLVVPSTSASTSAAAAAAAAATMATKNNTTIIEKENVYEMTLNSRRSVKNQKPLLPPPSPVRSSPDNNRVVDDGLNSRMDLDRNDATFRQRLETKDATFLKQLADNDKAFMAKIAASSKMALDTGLS
eukprot:CAMPEP_0171008370 /NCGR_PEP_ID=MMETSP0736-20130129/20508_1 /TAXON_ID=186038 /ORGANISM="Fragilariopsis kerguelensis, Strain L26-C5" /LENGTH=149 /DNA_ID=CAMNT_0011439425 /DNA_START=169 /DNA_END=618 /DNA_ORIENTATION=+